MNKITSSALALAVAVGLAACGGGNNGGGGAAKESLTFTGSFISGANYVSGARPDGGITGVDCLEVKPGCFDVLSAGDSVTFTLGSIALPELTTTAGTQELTTLDVARAIDPAATTTSPAYRAVYAVLEALDDGMGNPGDEGREFVVKPAVMGAPTADLKEIVDGAADAAALQTALAEAVEDSSGEAVMAGDIDLEASQASDAAQVANAGFDDGIEPINDNPFMEGEALAFVTSDLLGLWSANNDEGANGLFYSDDGNLNFANTEAASPKTPFGSFVENVPWNVINNVFVSQSTFTLNDTQFEGERQCIVSERVSASEFTFKCVDFTKLADPSAMYAVTGRFDANYSRINLVSVLSAGEGKWNAVFEEDFNETGSFTFAGNGTYQNTITETDNSDPNTNTSTVSGTYSVEGLLLRLMINPDDLEPDELDEANGSCAFAGIKRNAQGAIDDVYLRCGEEGDEEDVLLTKRDNVEPLVNTKDRSGEMDPMAPTE